jgi:tetraacyldisaccharide 4'-kinase
MEGLTRSRRGEEYLRRLFAGHERGLGPSTLRALLCIPSAMFGVGVALRNALFDARILPAEKAPCKVVSVGNLVAGGTGKTPMVEWLARWYRERAVPVAILSRGYGAVESQGGAGDEALLLHENLPDVPHLQGPRRAPLARRACEEHRARVAVLDDGFQHRWLRRDLDLVLLDGTHPRGFYRLLPRGMMREPFASLRRAHCVLLTRSHLAGASHLAWLREKVRAAAPDVPVVEATHRPTGVFRRDTGEALEAARLDGMRVLLVSGIGNPEAFERTARDLGMEIVGALRFPDHHAYSRSEIAEVEKRADRIGARAIVTTHKDIVKIGSWFTGPVPVCHLGIAVEVGRGRELLESLLESTLVD